MEIGKDSTRISIPCSMNANSSYANSCFLKTLFNIGVWQDKQADNKQTNKQTKKGQLNAFVFSYVYMYVHVRVMFMIFVMELFCFIISSFMICAVHSDLVCVMICIR